MVEVSLIAHFVMALGSATISASVLITGMLLFSGIGSLVSERILPQARRLMPVLFVALAGILIAYATGLDWVLNAIGTQDYFTRLLCCFALILPPAFLMGFPMPVAMTSLGQLGKEQMFIWAWGINGCFSVIGAALVPVISTSFGLDSVLTVSGLAYLLAGITFFAVLRPVSKPAPQGA
jgi:predicted membrane-bound spermidine synthase